MTAGNLIWGYIRLYCCKQDTGGNHEWNCPQHKNRIFQTMELGGHWEFKREEIYENLDTNQKAYCQNCLKKYYIVVCPKDCIFNKKADEK